MKRFRLRHLLLLPVGVAVLLAPIVRESHKYAGHGQAIAELRGAGIGVGTVYHSPSWMRAVLGDRLFETASSVHAENVAIDDRHILLIGRLDRLRDMKLENCDVCDADLSCFRELTELETLRLQRNNIKGDGLGHLTDAESLRLIDLSYCGVTDAAIPHLAKLQSLDHLDLKGAEISGRELQKLAGLRKLSYLNLWYARLSDADVDQLLPLFRSLSTRPKASITLEWTLIQKSMILRLKNQFPQLIFNHARSSPNDTHRRAAAIVEGRRGGVNYHVDLDRSNVILQHFWLGEPADLSALVGLRNLRRVLLSNYNGGTRFDDRYLEAMAETPITSIHLWDTGVTDAGLRHLTKIPHLEKLLFWDSNITDAGLDSLAELPDIKEIGFVGTRVTDRGVQALRRKLPGVKITRK